MLVPLPLQHPAPARRRVGTPLLLPSPSCPRSCPRARHCQGPALGGGMLLQLLTFYLPGTQLMKFSTAVLTSSVSPAPLISLAPAFF